MPCEHYKDALIEVAAVGAVPQGELRAHLAGCTSCRVAFDEEQSLFATIDSGLHVGVNAEVPTSLLPRVRVGLNEAEMRRLSWFQPLVLASAGVVLVLLVFLMARGTPENVAKQAPIVAAPVTPGRSANPEEISVANAQTSAIRVNHPHTPRDSTTSHSTASGNPEVLVPPDEREGLAKLVATLNERGDVAAAFLAQRPEKKDALVTVGPLKISDIEIKPLEGAETEPSDGTGDKH